MNLSKNFTLRELTRSDTAARHGLDNTPSPEIVANLKVLAEKVLQPIRDHFARPVSVSSGYRSPAVNTKAGGSKTSDHCKGMAADFEISGVPNYELAKWVKDNLKYKQLILEFYTPGVPDSGWVHVSYDPNNLRKQDLTATRKNGKVLYTPGLVA
jgi:hypothetical protein